ncbi:hypothetical protein RUND412_009363 [Rhizina undulata]
MPPRKITFLLTLTLLTLLLSITYLYPLPLPTAISAPSPPPPYTVTITETGGSHDEVIAALAHSFGSQPSATLSIYQLLTRYGIADVMSSYTLPKPLPKSQHPDRFSELGEMASGDMPDVFVAGTCELDTVKFKPQLEYLLEHGSTYLICVVHHADRWIQPELEAAVKNWVLKNRIEFWTLSPHTAEFLQRESISKWASTASGTTPLIRHFVPVFPVELSETEDEDAEESLSFGLQGDYDPSRRDYESLFSRLESFLSSSPSNISMHLLGHGTHPSVPASVQNHVVFDEHLDYTAFYTILSETFALLPAFATNEYLDRKASSSVPAALIAGTPLVATKEMLEAYSYVDEEVVWLQAEGKSDLDVVGEILKMEPEERRRKKGRVRRRGREIIEGNVGKVGAWVAEALRKVEKARPEKVVA